MPRTRSISCGFVFLIAVFALLAHGEAKDCPANEFYTDCGGSCQTECKTLHQPCLIRHIRCPDGCYCNEGYARDAGGTCIPVDMCR